MLRECGVTAVFLYWTAIAIPCVAEPTQLPDTDTHSRSLQSEDQDSKLLRNVFQSQFTKDQLAKFGEHSTLEALVGRMSKEQQSGARARLQELEADAKTPAELKQIAQGYLLLGEPQTTLAIAANLREQDPRSPQPYALAAQAYLKLGDVEKSADYARTAHARAPDDEAVFALLKLTEGRVNTGKVQLPNDPFNRKTMKSEESMSARATTSVLPADDSSKPLKPVVKGTAKSIDVPFEVGSKSSSQPPPSSPSWPWPAGLILSGLGAVWAVKKKLDHEGLTGPLAMTGLGLTLIAISLTFPPATPALVTTAGTLVAGGGAVVGQVVTGTAGSVIAGLGTKATLTQIVSNAQSNNSEDANQRRDFAGKNNAEASNGTKGNIEANSTAREIISKGKKGIINREFPSQHLDKTLAEIGRAAGQGDSTARKALKLLRDGRFNK